MEPGTKEMDCSMLLYRSVSTVIDSGSLIHKLNPPVGLDHCQPAAANSSSIISLRIARAVRSFAKCCCIRSEKK